MLFTRTAPTRQDERICLYFSPEKALAEGGPGPVYGVAVHFDGLRHQLLPLEPRLVDPGWTASAQYHDAGYLVAAAPLPQPLFLR